VDGPRTLRFDYVGKSGKRLEHEISDPLIAATVSELKHRRRRSPRLLAYRDEEGWRDVHADDVNRFIKQLMGADYSAKDFRTWHGTVLAALSLARSERPSGAAARRRAIRAAVQEAADALGNTPAVCKASYIDPRVFDRYRAGNTIATTLPGNGRGPRRAVLEAATLDLLS
jgi:DNA topoisomerase IB